MTKFLSLKQVKEISFWLAKGLMQWDEPIPDFETRFPGILESCLQAPMATFGKKNLYSTLEGRAAILFYLLIKNHPFQNGNKRLAVTSLMVFLVLNNKWLSLDHERLYRAAKWVAESDPEAKNGTVKALEDILKKNIEKLSKKT